MSIIEVTEATFEAEVLQEERFVVVDFWATYCMPCQMLTPILEELAAERPDIKFCKINMEEAQSIAEKYDIMTLPILIFFKNGTRKGFFRILKFYEKKMKFRKNNKKILQSN